MSTNPAIPVPPAEAKACRFASCVQLSVDGELDPGRAMDVETHLADCEPCAERAALLRSMKCSLRRKCEGRAPESLRAKIALAVAREASLEAGATEALPPHDASGRESFLHGLRDSRARGREDRVQPAQGGRSGRERSTSGRLAYGVGAFALAAGVALAFVGERMSSGERVADGGLADGQPGAAPRSDGSAEPSHRGSVGQGSIGQGSIGQGSIGQGSVGMGGPELVRVAVPSGPSGPELSPRAADSAEGRSTFDTMLDDLAALHANPLPPETTNLDELRKFEPIVGVKLRRPTFRSYDARFRGARLHAMRDTQRAALLQYVVRNDHRVTVYLFDPRAIPFGATRMQRRFVKEEPVYVGQFRGYSVAAAERRGVGYAVATDLDTDESVKMVAMAAP